MNNYSTSSTGDKVAVLRLKPLDMSQLLDQLVHRIENDDSNHYIRRQYDFLTIQKCMNSIQELTRSHVRTTWYVNIPLCCSRSTV